MPIEALRPGQHSSSVGRIPSRPADSSYIYPGRAFSRGGQIEIIYTETPTATLRVLAKTRPAVEALQRLAKGQGEQADVDLLLRVVAEAVHVPVQVRAETTGDDLRPAPLGG
jgi:hypothetical protein